MDNVAVADMVEITAGSFRMGSDKHYPEERPSHRAAVDGFWIDRRAVTNADFSNFITAEGYVTFAERPIDPALYPRPRPDMLKPGSAVFRMPGRVVRPRDLRDWWEYVIGADWRHPEGPSSTIAGREREPVVHVAFEDAVAYAAWSGKDLPTEAEWEFAARGGLDGAAYCWGDELRLDGKWMANTWQGEFPSQNEVLDGFPGRAPVGSFPANGYGLFDMAGNVWQWTKDWYAAGHPHNPGQPCCAPQNPRGVAEVQSYDKAQPGLPVARKVIKGGRIFVPRTTTSATGLQRATRRQSTRRPATSASGACGGRRELNK
jgi:formylglycine-generating enzyme